MIKEEMYIKCLKDLEKYSEWEDKLAELGINIWENEELQDIIMDLTMLLEYCTKDEVTKLGTNLGYYLYECEFGKKANDYYITEADGNIVKFHKPVDVWNYLVKCNPDIEDKGDY